MSRVKFQRDGWATAQEPQLVTAPAQQQHVSREQKQREADQMRAEVEAHIRAGGSFEKVSTPRPAKRKGRA